LLEEEDEEEEEEEEEELEEAEGAGILIEEAAEGTRTLPFNTSHSKSLGNLDSISFLPS
jgi:hypothetical protein